MTRRVIEVSADPERFALAVLHPDKTVGFIMGPDCDVLTFPTRREAERTLKKLMKDDNYTWSHPVEVRPYPPRK